MEIKDLLEKDAAIFYEQNQVSNYRKMNCFERSSLILKCEELKILSKISKALDVMAFGEKITPGAGLSGGVR